MKNWFLAFFLLFSSFSGISQNISTLFENKSYGEIVAADSINSRDYTGEECYMIGFSYFKQENDSIASLYFDKAIDKGYKTANVFYHKALTFIYIDSLLAALRPLETAITLEPDNQDYVTEKGFIYYYLDDLNTALSVFREARDLPNTLQVPHYMVPHIYEMQGKYDIALEEYYNGLDSIDFDNNYQIKELPIYMSTLIAIANIEYSKKRNYFNSIKLYEQIVDLMPFEFGYHENLAKSYSAIKRYEKTDSVYQLMKIAYIEKKLPEKYNRTESMIIEEFYYEGYNLAVQRSFVKPQKKGDAEYYFFVLNENKSEIEAIYLSEKQNAENGETYSLCKESKNGIHYTYAHSWKSEIIDYKELRQVVLKAMQNEILIVDSTENK